MLVLPHFRLNLTEKQEFTLAGAGGAGKHPQRLIVLQNDSHAAHGV